MDKEEKRLGLDPSKYTKKPWNPADYIGSTEVNPIPIDEIINDVSGAAIGPRMPIKLYVDMMREQLREQQERQLGEEPKQLTPEEQAESNRMKLKILMGG